MIALSVVFALKLAVLSSVGQHPLLVPAGDFDSAYYFHLAQRVAAGDVWLLGADSFFGEAPPAFFLPPLYIYVLALFFKLGGGAVEAARFAQILLGALGVGLLALTARRWFGTAAGWWAGALAATSGLFTFYEILILPAALEPALAALDLYLLTRALQAGADAAAGTRERLLWWAAAGAALGLHALNRPPMLIVLAGLAGLLIVRRALRVVERQSAVGPIVFLLAALVLIAPVTLRNYRATGHVVLITSTGGLNFLIGNGPEANGTFGAAMGVRASMRGQWLDAPPIAKGALGRDVTTPEVSAFFRDRAVAWIREHPAAEVRLLGAKAWYALSTAFATINHSYPFFARDLAGPLGWLVVGPALIVPLGFVGLVLARPRREGYGIWAAYVPLAILSVVTFYVAARYRLPYQMALCAPAGGAIAWAWDRLRARAWRSVAGAAALTAVVAVPVLWPARLDDGRAEEQARMGLQEIQSDRYAEGEAWIERAATRHALPGIVHLRAGQIYELRNQRAPAIVHYRKALVIDADQPVLHVALGRALFREGQYAEAVTSLERGRTGPQADVATRLLVLALTRLGRTADANAAVRALDPSRWDADTAREYALSLTEVGRIDLASTAWTRAAAASNDAKDYERLGLSWAVLGRNPEAIAAFSNAVERDPRSATIRLNYAVAWASVGRYADARREGENALKLNPAYERAKEFLRSLPK